MTTRRAATALAAMDRTADEERHGTCICSVVATATIATSVPRKKQRSQPSLPTPSPPPAATTPMPSKPQAAARSSGPPRRNPAAGSGHSGGGELLPPNPDDMKEKKNKDKFAKKDDIKKKNKCHLNVSVKIEEIPEDNIAGCVAIRKASSRECCKHSVSTGHNIKSSHMWQRFRCS